MSPLSRPCSGHSPRSTLPTEQEQNTCRERRRQKGPYGQPGPDRRELPNSFHTKTLWHNCPLLAVLRDYLSPQGTSFLQYVGRAKVSCAARLTIRHSRGKPQVPNAFALRGTIIKKNVAKKAEIQTIVKYRKGAHPKRREDMMWVILEMRQQSFIKN